MLEKKIQVVVAFFAVGMWLYFFYTPVTHIISDKIKHSSICNRPIKYSIGTFDTKFGLTKEEYLQDIESAAKLWEDVNGLNLFEYSTSSDRLPINLVYDERQSTTSNLKELGNIIDSNKTKIDLESMNLNQLQETYNSKKVLYTNLLGRYNTELNQYNTDVTQANKLNSITLDQEAYFTNKKKDLDTKLLEIRNLEKEINSLAETLNKQSGNLHAQVQEVNQTIAVYNQNSASFAEEFNEGEYIEKDGKDSIYVYQFDSKKRLIRLLAHELGHSLGIEHVDDTGAVMYRLNNKDTLVLTQADKDALNKVCEQSNDIFYKVFHRII